MTTAAEAVTLDAPDNVNLSKLVGKRILTVGRYNTQTGVMVVTDAADMEVLPAQIVPIPTTIPTPTPTSISTPSPTLYE